MRSLFRTLSLRYLWRRWPRAALVVASIALGVATLVATRALNEMMGIAARGAATPLAGLADLYVGNGDSGVRRDLIPLVAVVPGVARVEPLLLEHVLLPELNNRPAILVGVDLAKAEKGDNAWGVKVHVENPLLLLSGKPAVFAGKDLAETLGKVAPGNFHILASGYRHDMPHWSGTVEAHGPASLLGGSVLFMEAAAAAKVLGKPDLVSRLDVKVDASADPEQIADRIRQALGDRAQVQTPESTDQKVQDVMAGLQLGFSLCGTGALVIGLFLVYNTLMVSVAERRHEIGILRSLGATRSQVAALFLGESLFLGLAGAALGIPGGWILAHIGLGPLRQVVSDLLVALESQKLEVHVSRATFLIALFAGVTTALAASLFPALQAASEEPAAAVRRIPRPAQAGGLLLRLLGGLLFLGLGSGAVFWRKQLPPRVGSYGGLVLVVFCLLLITPTLASILARLLQPLARALMGVEGRLAADNLVRSPGRTGLVITALAAGVAMIMQTAGLIRSNEDTILEWVDQTMAADLFVTSGSAISGGGQNQPLPENIGMQIEKLPEVAECVPARFRQIDYGKTIIFIIGLDAERFLGANKNKEPVPGLELYANLHVPGQRRAILSENFAALHHVKAGDTLELLGLHGPVELHVIGTVVDFSWNRGTVILDRADYREIFDDPLVDVFDVYLRPGSDADNVRETMMRRWGAEHALVVLKREELRGQITSLIRRIYGLAYSQEIVVGLVAALGVVTALLISVLQRRRELGLLRAVGATRMQILWTVLAEATLMGVIGTAIGLAVGIPLEWYCLKIILFEEAGFLFPMIVPWSAAVFIAGVAIITATVAGLGPAIHTSRLRIPEAISYE